MAAPTLDNSASPTLGTVSAGSSDPSGVTIAGWVVAGSIGDADGSPLEAVAITALNTSLGAWQYKLGGSGPWLTIRADLLDSSTNELALHLGPTDKLRLLPFGMSSGDLSDAVTFRAWDTSNGVSAGQYAVITGTGGNTAYSSTSDDASISVAAANQAPSFAAGSGQVASPVGGGQDVAASAVLQPDGKLVIAGTNLVGSVRDFAVLRLNVDGTTDTSFSGDGRLTLPVGSGIDVGNAVALMPDGRIVVAGASVGATNDDFGIVRLLPDGSLDPSFDADGKLVLPVGAGYDGVNAIAVQPDGRIVLAGLSEVGSDYAYGLVRLNVDGSLDTSFGLGGKVVIDLIAGAGGSDEAYAVAIQADGRILAAGYSQVSSHYEFSAVRLQPDGSLDSSFDGDGKVTVAVGPQHASGRSLAVQSDGRIVIAGYSWSTSPSASSVVRLNPDGSLDTGFDSDGRLILSIGTGAHWVEDVTVQSDGRILVAGYKAGTNDIPVVTALNADGSPATDFGSGGTLVVPTPPGSGRVVEVLEAPGGRIVLAGRSGGTAMFSASRLLANGTLDKSFGPSSGDSLGGTVSYTEGGAPVALDTSVTLIDAEMAALAGGAGNYAGASITLARAGGANSEDSFGSTGNLVFSGGDALLSGVNVGSVTSGGGSLVLTFNANATQMRLNEAISSFSYANTSSNPIPSLQVQWTFSDGSGATANGFTTVNNHGINLAPLLGTAASPTLGSVASGTAEPAGLTIAALVVDGSISDADGNPLEAIAITALNTSLGAWQYQLGGSGPWLTIHADLLNSSTTELALHLGPTDKLRLLPYGTLSGSLSDAVTFRAWDTSNGVSAGQYAVITASGGNTAYSSASDSAAIEVALASGGPNRAPSFAVGTGRAAAATGSNDDEGRAAVLQPDGKLVVVGTTGGSSADTRDFAVLRLNIDGTPDTSFSGDGRLALSVGTARDEANAVALMADGRIVVAGRSRGASNEDFSVVRLLPEGSLDTSFDGDGKLIVPVGSGFEEVRALAIQPDGKAVLVGYSLDTAGDWVYTLVRLNLDGSLDSGFGSGGKVTIDLIPGSDGQDEAHAVALQADGRIVAAGYSWVVNHYEFSAVRVNADGSLDASFDSDGKVTVPVGASHAVATSVALQGDGKIVIAGYSRGAADDDSSIVRLNADGSLDTGFDGDGRLVVAVGTEADRLYGIALQGDGRIVAAGAGRLTGAVIYTLQIDRDGTLDSGFGSGGTQFITPPPGGGDVTGLLTTPGDRIVLVGTSYAAGQDQLNTYRLLATGAFDTSFGALPGGSLGGTASFSEGGPPVVLDSSVAVTDPDMAALAGGAGNYAGASVTLAREGGARAQDLFGASGSLVFSRGDALLSGLNIGSVTSGGGSLQITFNTNATQARLNEALSSLTYANSSVNPTPSLQVMWAFSDGSGGTASGFTTVTNSGTNVAPVLDAAASPSLGSVAGNSTDPAGVTIAALVVDGSISDADGALEAIAITALDTSLGSWQFKLDGSGTWQTVDAGLLNSTTNQLALHLGPTDQIRLLPYPGLAGNLSSAITFRAWDTSNGFASGQYAVIGNGGGTSPNSVATDTASVNVALGNTAPTFAPRLGTGKLFVSLDGSDDAYASAVQADGKLIVVGRTGRADTDMVVLRVNPDGSLDPSFGGGDGVVSIPISTIGGDDTAYTVAIQRDGRIVVAGETFDNLGSGNVSGVGIARLNADGTLDTGFATGGSAFLPNRVLVNASAIQTDGSIVLAGETHTGEVAVLRLLANGTPDSGFGANGLLVVAKTASRESATSIAVQPDGGIVVGGTSRAGGSNSADFLVLRMSANGTLDDEFDTDGRAVLAVGARDDESYALELQADGKIVVAGYSAVGTGSDWEFAVLRLTRSGTLDTSFDGDGRVLVRVDAGVSYAWSLALQNDGSIVVGGTAGDGQSRTGFGVVRLNADGSLDTSFGGDGKSLTLLSSSEQAYSVQALPDDGVVAAGYARGADSTSDIALVRLTSTGALDTGFGGEAAPTLGNSITYDENGAAVALDTSVRIVDAELAALDGGAGNYAGALLTLAREGGANADDQFGARGNLVFAGSDVRLSGVSIATLISAGGTLGLLFNAGATQARVDEAVSSLNYFNISDTPPASLRIGWTFSDGNAGAQGAGGALQALGVTTVSIRAVNDAPQGSLTITGEPIVGRTLNLGSTVSDPDGITSAVTLQWQRGSSEIAGATAAAYTLVEADLGQAISVRMRYTDSGGTAESVTSAPTAAVAPALNIVDGTPDNDTLAGSAGTDQLRGLDGNDVLRASAGPDTLDGGAGLDVVTFLGSVPVTVDLSAGSASRGGQAQSLAGIEGVLGSDLADSLTGAAEDPQDPFRYDDILRGRGGNDQIDGAGGVDFAEYTGQRLGYVVTRTGPASFTVQDIDPSDGDDGSDTLSGIERIVFADQMLSFGERAEELARVAFVLWTKDIVGSAALFSRGMSFYDAGYDFVTMSVVAMQFWADHSDLGLAERLVANSGTSKSVEQMLQIMAENGGGIPGRAAAARDAAMDAGTTLLIEQSDIRTTGIVADNVVQGFGQLIHLLPGG